MVLPTPTLTRNWKAVVLCATWGLLLVQGSVLPALGQDSPGDSRPVPAHMGRVVVTSDPTGQSIVLDGHRLDAKTPAELDLNPGQYYMTLNAQDYQPLNHDVAVSTGELAADYDVLVLTEFLLAPLTAQFFRFMRERRGFSSKRIKKSLEFVVLNLSI